MWIAIGIGVVLVLLVLWFVNCQRRLVQLDELCGNALSQIGVQQSSRWDALTALAQLTKSYSEHEYSTLMEVIGKRQAVGSGSTAAQADAQENMLTQAMGRIIAVGEAYPDLKAQATYTKTMDNVKEFETNVRYARMSFNDTVTKFNREVRMFPGSLAASMLHFRTRDYLQEEPGKTQMPNMNVGHE